MFIPIPSIIAKRWKQPRCSSTDELINKCGISIQWDLFDHKKE